MTIAADRHLLFGMLALQNGIITLSQLTAAFRAWSLDKSRITRRSPRSSVVT